jgi:hypothetical protein
MDEKMNERIMEDLKSLIKMKESLRTRGNLSASELDGITNSWLKSQREKATRMLTELMKLIITTGFCSREWRNARTILLYKDDDRDGPENWRPITVMSVICRTIFCRIT